MATTVYNVFNGDDCAFESLTKEQIYDLIANSIQQGELVGVDADKPFVTKIKEQNKGAALKFWVGTQAEFNAIQTKEQNCFYIISDSTAQEDIENTLAELEQKANATEPILNAVSQFLRYATEGHNGFELTSGANDTITCTKETSYRIVYYCVDDFTGAGYKTIYGGAETEGRLYILSGEGEQSTIGLTVYGLEPGQNTVRIENTTDKTVYVAILPYHTEDIFNH